jgi:2-dehydro-3-deoxy-D-arabinonate dehydratase
MKLTRHDTQDGARWALDGLFLPAAFTLRALLQRPRAGLAELLSPAVPTTSACGALLPPLEPDHEVWACGVTYLRSREARHAESSAGDVYLKVYAAERPELFLKAIGWRCVGDGAEVGVRADSTWDVPEPELALVFNSSLEIVGYCAGNDMSSRSIEGENPLYLPQAKIYTAACALGPGIVLAEPAPLSNLPIGLRISRAGERIFSGETSTARMKRRLEELVAYLGRALAFPYGGLLMTGTGIVPPDGLTLQPGDLVEVQVGTLRLTNTVRRV